MIRVLKNLVLAIVVFSLPLQGLMAATMPFCAHMTKVAQLQSEHVHYDAQNHAQHEHGKNPGSTGLACDNCGSCEVCMSPALSGAVTTATLAVAPSPQPRPAFKLSLFFPELFQRPPLALAA